MLKKNIAAIVCCFALTTALSGCGQKNISVSDSKTEATTSAAASAAAESSNLAFGEEVKNYTAPENGEKILIIKVKDYGEIKIKLFPEYAEKGVENILGLADKSYYNGVIFHRIINNFMIQGGDPTGTGRGGESIYGKSFDGGTDPHLIHVSGAVAYANSGSTASNGSQFYIVTGEVYDKDQIDQLRAGGYTFTDNEAEVYSTYGGAPWLDGGYTIFGQVYDGLDVVFKIQEAETGSNDKPTEDVIIEKITITDYSGGDVHWNIKDYN